jgi:hypothetical protein
MRPSLRLLPLCLTAQAVPGDALAALQYRHAQLEISQLHGERLARGAHQVSLVEPHDTGAGHIGSSSDTSNSDERSSSDSGSLNYSSSSRGSSPKSYISANASLCPLCTCTGADKFAPLSNRNTHVTSPTIEEASYPGCSNANAYNISTNLPSKTSSYLLEDCFQRLLSSASGDKPEREGPCACVCGRDASLRKLTRPLAARLAAMTLMVEVGRCACTREEIYAQIGTASFAGPPPPRTDALSLFVPQLLLRRQPTLLTSPSMYG